MKREHDKRAHTYVYIIISSSTKVLSSYTILSNDYNISHSFFKATIATEKADLVTLF